MTLKEVNIYFKAISKKHKNDMHEQDIRVARILCMLANINRDSKKKPKPYSEQDFMPQEEKKKQTPEDMALILKALTLGMGGEIK